MKRCAVCLYTTSKPDLAFDAEGVCSACTAYQNRSLINWEARWKDLLCILERSDGRVIVPSSGGKDSTYIALRMKELGADVTAVTATTCDLTPIGRANIDNLARYVRTIEVTPNRTVRAKLNRIAMEMVGDPSWPEHVSIHRVPFRIASEMKIPVIMYGECPQNQYGGPPGTEGTMQMTQRWASEFAGFLGLRAQDFVAVDGITRRDMEDYTAPSDEELESANVTAYFLGAFEQWDSHRNAKVAGDAGMKWVLPTVANWWSFENVDSFQTGIHDFLGWLKYGYGRASAQLSVDIRSGLLSRNDALEYARDRDGEFPLAYMGDSLENILGRIDVTPDKFIKVCSAFVNWSLFGDEHEMVWGERLSLED